MTHSLFLDAGVEPILGYSLVRLLGRGGFGEVWEASAPGGFLVALKFVRLGTAASGVEERALEVIRNIRHPHLLDVQFATQVADCLVIATPLCDENLMDRLLVCQAKGLSGIPRNELLVMMDELSRAIDYLNEPRHKMADGSLVGIQHRDIKPLNVFLVGGSVRLADFGLAKLLSASVASHTGCMSPHYVAPEVIGGRFSQQSDQYSLAVTYFELRTGTKLIDGENVLQIIHQHINADPDLSRLPEAERPIVARALAKRPEERWPRCRDFWRALVVVARNTGRGNAITPPKVPVTDVATNPPDTQPLSAIPFIRIADENLSVAKVKRSGSRRSRYLGIGLAALLGFIAYGAALLPSPRPKLLSDGESPLSARPAPGSTPVSRTIPLTKTISKTSGMTLMLIPAGEFLMGSPDSDKDAEDHEMPQHRVRITRPFYLGATEVTVGQFRRVVEATGLQTEAETNGKGGIGWDSATNKWAQDPSFSWRNHGRPQGDDWPVYNVTWNDAIAFCDQLSKHEGLTPFDPSGARVDGYRLPTEAEWEYACRAGTTTRYQSGDDPETLVQVGNIADNANKKGYDVGRSTIAANDGYVGSAPVGGFRPNAFGLYDMHGNAWERCLDGYLGNYYSVSPSADPFGPVGRPRRVVRGGSWIEGPKNCRSASRGIQEPDYLDYHASFRVARDIPIQ